MRDRVYQSYISYGLLEWWVPLLPDMGWDFIFFQFFFKFYKNVISVKKQKKTQHGLTSYLLTMSFKRAAILCMSQVIKF